MHSLEFFFVLTVLIVAAVHINGDELDELTEDQKKLAYYAIQCMDKEHASSKDFEDIAEFRLPESREGRCMTACVAEKIGMIQDGKFSPDGAVIGVSLLVPQSDPDREATIEQMKEMAAACNADNEDRCELITDILLCFHD